MLTNTQIKEIFERSPGFDLRHLLQGEVAAPPPILGLRVTIIIVVGSEKFIDNILNITDSDPSYLLNGVSNNNVNNNNYYFYYYNFRLDAYQ